MIGSLAAQPGQRPGAAAEDAMMGLVSECEQPLHRFLLSLLRDHHAARDCAQDTFLRAHVALREGHRVNRQWIFTVARNRAMDEFRRRRRIASDPELITRAHTCDHTDRALMVRQALDRLDPLDARVLSLFAVAGYRTDEIGEMVGLSGAAVRQRLYRAREKFRRVWGDAA